MFHQIETKELTHPTTQDKTDNLEIEGPLIEGNGKMTL